jgi:hypothetical protein
VILAGTEEVICGEECLWLLAVVRCDGLRTFYAVAFLSLLGSCGAEASGRR